jgi:sRNA-binding carbon storage regulator CsrA
MGIIFLLGGMVSLGTYVYINHLDMDSSSFLERKKNTKIIIEDNIDKALLDLYRETYPNVTEEKLKMLLKTDKTMDYIRKEINISIKAKGEK